MLNAQMLGYVIGRLENVLALTDMKVLLASVLRVQMIVLAMVLAGQTRILLLISQKQ
jgi:hypothetical protein